MDDDSTVTTIGRAGVDAAVAEERPTLVLLWSASQPNKAGEVALMPARGFGLLGRGRARSSDPHPRIRFVQQRPDANIAGDSLSGAGLSREQLRIKGLKDRLELENLGKCPLRIAGKVVDKGVARPGDLVELEGVALFAVEPRPYALPRAFELAEGEWPDFGQADTHGVVGESAEAWALRDRLAFVARREAHVLVLGESGVGKELAARWIHGLGARAARPLVSRNAATIPDSLIDAELFGHARNYPNPGVPEREGLVGEADGGTLFLDEIGEMPSELQAHLLRVLDTGEYQRLGEPRRRRADFRLVAATNRAPETLKHDFRARLKLDVRVPDLNARRADVPLLARHLLRRIAGRDAGLKARFFEGDEPRIDPTLIGALYHHRYSHNVRELEALLWVSLGSARGDTLELTSELQARMGATPDEVDPATLDEASIKEALEAADGSAGVAARTLGLKNRFQLYRLMKKFGLK